MPAEKTQAPVVKAAVEALMSAVLYPGCLVRVTMTKIEHLNVLYAMRDADQALGGVIDWDKTNAGAKSDQKATVIELHNGSGIDLKLGTASANT